MSNKIKAIKNIENKYGAFLFGMALTHLVDIGARHLTDFNFNEAVKQINETNAKACKESVVLFLLRPDNIMPILVRVPVSSKMLFQRYMTRLIGKMIPVSGVVTKITLEKTTNKSGQPYALYNFEAVETLSTQEAENARTFGKSFMELVNASSVNRELQKAC